MRRATKTAYYLNRTLKRLALIGGNVRFPVAPGIWLLVADAERQPWEVASLLAASYPGMANEEVQVVSLLTDFDVDEFERSLRSNG